MPKAIFKVPIVNDNAVVPPMSDDDGGTQLHYDDNGTLRGGFSLIGQVPQVDECLALIHSSQKTIDAMAADKDNTLVEHEDEQLATETPTIKTIRQSVGVLLGEYARASATMKREVTEDE